MRRTHCDEQEENGRVAALLKSRVVAAHTARSVHVGSVGTRAEGFRRFW